MTLPETDLSGRVAIVSGGGTGIGAATARLLGQQGADVVIASRKKDILNAKAEELRADTGRKILAVPTDVRKDEDVAHLIKVTIEELGRLDILVNNAGGAYMFPLSQTPPKRWDNAYDLNIRSAYLCSYHAYDHLYASPYASIVNISSTAGVSGVMGGAAYGSAKAALQQFTRITAAEWGPKGIRCNCVAVGAVASEGAVRSWSRFGRTPEQMGELNPLRRVGQPEDIARGVLYFASDMSSWVTGQIISIDGGPQMSGTVQEDD